MKTKILVLLAMIVLLLTSAAKAQTSHKSGFYNVDSLYFKVNWVAGANQQIWVSVNRFSDDGYQPYSGGVWLKKRAPEMNTWENVIYARNPCNYPFDSILPSGDRNKTNVVRVVLFDTVTQTVVKDSVYVIGLGAIPHTIHMFFVTLDSLDFADMQNRYEEDIRVRAWLHVFSPTGVLEVNQPVEFYIAAGSSACIANKGFTVKATNKPPVFGPKKMKTSVFSSTVGALQDEYKIKLRSGNGGQIPAFGINEIMQRIINYPNWRIGGVENAVSILYINGSYWSLTFPQRKPDERYVASVYGVDKDSVDLIRPIPFNIYYDTMYAGYKTFYDTLIVGSDTTIYDSTFAGTWVRFDFEYDTIVAGFFRSIGFDTLQFFQAGFIDTTISISVTNPDGQRRIIASAEEGTNRRAKPIAQTLVNLARDTLHDHYDTLVTLIDLDSWLRYLCLVNHFNMNDVIDNNVGLGLTPQNKLFILMEDFDDVGVWGGINASNWNSKILGPSFTSYFGFMREVIQKIILKSPKAIDRMMLVYQDMLNTGLLPDRLTGIADTFRPKVMPYYKYNYEAWGGYPNGGRDSIGQEQTFSEFRNFVSSRRLPALQLLTNQFQPQYLYNVLDTNNVHIVFDSIATNLVTLEFNSLTLTKSWSGPYLPKPVLQISYTVKNGYNIVIKEYPDSSRKFQIFSDTDITLTFVLRPATLLPVELVSFGCKIDSGSAKLSWSTASEINNTGFTVERSLDGIQFDSIAFVPGAGTSNQFRNYSFEDRTTLSDDVYYRIKQVDADGSYTYSDICMLSMPELITNIPEEVLVYPNPTNGIIYVKNTASIQKISVYDVLSRLVYENDSVFTEIPLGILPKGTYAIMFTLKNGEQITKKVTLF